MVMQRNRLPLRLRGAEVSTVFNALIGCDLAVGEEFNTKDMVDSCEGIENCIVAAENCDDSPNALACNVQPN